jgi:hypothetical protein
MGKNVMYYESVFYMSLLSCMQASKPHRPPCFLRYMLICQRNVFIKSKDACVIFPATRSRHQLVSHIRNDKERESCLQLLT